MSTKWSRQRRGIFASLVFLGLIWAVMPRLAGAEEPTTGVPWPATDALGRKLPLAGEAPAPRHDRFVGIFYFLWHENRSPVRAGQLGPLDVSKILARDPDALKHPNSSLWGPNGLYHYWGEPLFGYYLAEDPWVIRRHAQLLAAAGVDTLIFDATNAIWYPKVTTALCETFRQVRKAGGRTPRIAYMVNTEAGRTARDLYDHFYKPGLYRELWFTWNGKPLLICDPKEADPELRGFFTLRRAHWPFTMVNTRNAWHWEATYPQPYGFTDDPGKAEQVNVSVAQNLRAVDGRVTNMSAGDARGRGFHEGRSDHSREAITSGRNFQEQWKRALDVDPPFVMVTGWNEWIAGRWKRPGDPIVFVDQFNQEFSRDTEPMKGGHGDNFYYQLVAGIRGYKGVPPLPAASSATTIDAAGGFEPWRTVAPEFHDDASDTLPRDFAGAAGLHYTNHTGRNNLVACKIARDANNVYAYARTAEPLTRPSGSSWMLLFLDVDRDPRTGWKGYDFVVNRIVDPDGTTWLERNKGGWRWEKVQRVSLRFEGRELHLTIPRRALGLSSGTNKLAIDFKWADNLQHPGDVMDFYTSGDVAPEGRFKFRYVAD